jgi:hypothetical protein
MAQCNQCRTFFPVPENADDFKPGNGDCVREVKDEKGKYWLSKPVMASDLTDKCPNFAQKN